MSGSAGRRYVVIGGGIIGLATAYRITRERPGADVLLLEKEQRLATHQTGRNSGVIHAGVYYRPGSLKARLCRVGSESMRRFCAEYGVPMRVCGKLIVATAEAELPRLRGLYDRARENGLPVRLIGPEQAREYEPAVRCLAALRVDSTAIVDFTAVCARLADLATEGGARIRLGTRVIGVTGGNGALVVRTTGGEVPADVLVNCAGLHADRVARAVGLSPDVRIVPFRGEYYNLRPDRVGLVRGLIYPVPDPRLPFLGVHLTRTVDGGVHAGPNAVLALAREGYRWTTVRPRDLAELAGNPGLWRLARRHLTHGVTEVRRSLSRARFAADLARLVPGLSGADLLPGPAGVRAQAVARDGSLVDDFLLARADRQVHVLNAPSPAATSALEIARHIVARLPG